MRRERAWEQDYKYTARLVLVCGCDVFYPLFLFFLFLHPYICIIPLATEAIVVELCFVFTSLWIYLYVMTA